MAGVKGKAGRKKNNPNETPEEKRARYNANARRHYHKKKAEIEEQRLKAIEEKFNNEITGGM